VKGIRATVASLIASLLVAIAAPSSPATSRSAPLPGPSGPTLRVPAWKLENALACPDDLSGPVVLLVHGTSVTAEENWSWNYELALPHEGFATCTVQLPDRELIDVQVTSEYVVYAIRAIAHRAGHRIDVIGLSQGALQPRWAIKWWPDIRHLVEDYVSMAGTNHGSIYADAGCAGGSCLESLWQQRVQGSMFLPALNGGDETPGDVSYTSVYSLTDDIIQPAFPTPVAAIHGASNIAVQDICPGRYVGHVQSASDAAYYAAVIDALQHDGPAKLDRIDRSYCSQTFMPYVDPATAAAWTALIYVTAGVVQSVHPKSDHEPPLRPYARPRS
jgi:triacylglycerol esterase/lipase EstA (alpha/beta hydrolase family)